MPLLLGVFLRTPHKFHKIWLWAMSFIVFGMIGLAIMWKLRKRRQLYLSEVKRRAGTVCGMVRKFINVTHCEDVKV